jgi:sigma-E factor negative regulatory protein RseA
MKHANDSHFYAEQLSALADNELSASEVTAVVHACDQDSSLINTWASYHTIGDLLRVNALDARTRDLQTPVPAAQSITLTQPTAAANDSVFRWKMVAGVAAVAAVGSVLWAMVGTPSGLGGLGGAQLAQQTGGQPAAVAAAPASASGNVVAANDNVQVMIRDPRLDELLAAHKQFGGASALQQPAGFLRNATFNPTGR